MAGRPATDPQVVLAVWLYATLEGIGSARAIDRLCQQHAAYRWLCGGAPINHDLLATFRREHAASLDRLLTQSVTGLIAEKLISLEELAIDGTKARACAGRGSMSKAKRLERIEKAVAERVAELKSELDNDPAEPERRRKKRALQAAEERARRVERAQQKLAELVQEQAERAKTHAKEEAEKGEPRVSVSDPEARLMRLADGAVAPAWNVQSCPGAGRGGHQQRLHRWHRSDRSAQGQRIGAGTGRDHCRALWPGAATAARRYHGDDPRGHRQTGRTPSRSDGLQPAAAGAHRGHRRDAAQAALETPPRAVGGPGVASANGERGRPRNLPPAQADRTGARHHQEPRHVPVPGAWPGESPGGLRAASAGPQPVLGQHAASPHCRGGSNGDAGDRMTAAGRISNAIPYLHAMLQPNPVRQNILTLFIHPVVECMLPGDTSHAKSGDWVTPSSSGRRKKKREKGTRPEESLHLLDTTSSMASNLCPRRVIAHVVLRVAIG